MSSYYVQHIVLSKGNIVIKFIKILALKCFSCSFFASSTAFAYRVLFKNHFLSLQLLDTFSACYKETFIRQL